MASTGARTRLPDRSAMAKRAGRRSAARSLHAEALASPGRASCPARHGGSRDRHPRRGWEKAGAPGLDQQIKTRQRRSYAGWLLLVAPLRPNACEHAAPRAVANRPPARWLVVRLAGTGVHERRRTGIRGRFACGVCTELVKNRRSGGDKRWRCAGIFTGATGLEPAFPFHRG